MKKGFTLIELLAVIIILAIIALIATPIILNVINDARKSAGLSEASMILSGNNNYCATSAMKNQLDGSVDICADGVTKEDVSQMVSLGNAEVLEVEYENGKVTKLKVKSNNYEFELQPDGIFSVDGEATDPINPTPGDDEYVDASGANKPKLYNNMIPIKYDGSNWVYAYERVMANMVDSSGTFLVQSSGFTNTPEEKYYDKYTYGTSATTHTRGKLGDATKETLTTFGSATGGWYSDYATFVDSNLSWFSRERLCVNDVDAGVFSFDSTSGVAFDSYSSRAVLS